MNDIERIDTALSNALKAVPPMTEPEVLEDDPQRATKTMRGDLEIQQSALQANLAVAQAELDTMRIRVADLELAGASIDAALDALAEEPND